MRVFAEFWEIKETCAFGWESVGASFFVCAALAANAALARLDPSEVGKGSETRDDEEKCVGMPSSVKSSRKSLDLPHSAYARRAPFVAFRDISPVWRGNRPELGKAESLKMLRMRRLRARIPRKFVRGRGSG